MTNYNNSWTDSEVNSLAKALTFCYKNADKYGDELELKERVEGFRFTLEGEFSVESILGAIKQHMKKSTTMVKPAHIDAILRPEEKKISQSEYIAAQKRQERNGWPSYSAEAFLIKEYEKQENKERELSKPMDSKLLEYVNVNKIG